MTLIVLLNALFASSFSMGKLLIAQTTPIFLTGVRMLLGGVVLLTYQWFWAPHHFKFKKSHIWLFAQMIFFGVYINYISRFWALNYISSTKTCFLYNFQPFLSSFYSYILYNERMTHKQWGGLCLGFIGMLPILLSSSPSEDMVGEFFFLSLPEIAVLISVATHSYSWLVLRRLVKDKSYTPMMANGLSMACGGVLALVTSYYFEGTPTIKDTSTFVGLVSMVTLISNIICYNLYGFLLKRYTPTFLAFASFLCPLFAALYGWSFLNETITWHFYASSIIVFFGLYIFYRDELRLMQIRENTFEL